MQSAEAVKNYHQTSVLLIVGNISCLEFTFDNQDFMIIFSEQDYPWWDLDGCDFAAILHGILTPFQLTDHTYKNWDDFIRKDPDLAYAWSVGVVSMS